MDQLVCLGLLHNLKQHPAKLGHVGVGFPLRQHVLQEGFYMDRFDAIQRHIVEGDGNFLILYRCYHFHALSTFTALTFW